MKIFMMLYPIYLLIVGAGVPLLIGKALKR